MPGGYASIQAAIDAAHSGDLVRVAPGVCHGRVVVPEAKHDVVIPGEDRNRVVDEGGGRHAVGIAVRGEGAAIENLTVRGFRTAGVLVDSSARARRPLRGWRVSYVTALGDGRLGVAARGARGGTVEHVVARGHTEAGVMLADCDPCDAVVVDSAADGNRAGFEARDAGGNVVVARSHFRRNRIGVVLVSERTGEAAALQRDVTVAGNAIVDNDDPRAPGGGDRFGVGVLVRGGLRDAVARNLIASHPAAGVLLEGSPAGPATEISVQGNIVTGAGVSLAVVRGDRQPSSKGSCFAQNRFDSASPTNIERVLPCQADVPLPAVGPDLPPPPPPAPAPRRLRMPHAAEQPDAAHADPRPARPPSRLDVARIGVPGDS